MLAHNRKCLSFEILTIRNRVSRHDQKFPFSWTLEWFNFPIFFNFNMPWWKNLVHCAIYCKNISKLIFHVVNAISLIARLESSLWTLFVNNPCQFHAVNLWWDKNSANWNPINRNNNECEVACSSMVFSWKNHSTVHLNCFQLTHSKVGINVAASVSTFASLKLTHSSAISLKMQMLHLTGTLALFSQIIGAVWSWRRRKSSVRNSFQFSISHLHRIQFHSASAVNFLSLFFLVSSQHQLSPSSCSILLFHEFYVLWSTYSPSPFTLRAI